MLHPWARSQGPPEMRFGCGTIVTGGRDVAKQHVGIGHLRRLAAAFRQRKRPLGHRSSFRMAADRKQCPALRQEQIAPSEGVLRQGYVELLGHGQDFERGLHVPNTQVGLAHARCEDRVHLGHFEIEADLPGVLQQRQRLCMPPLRHADARAHMIDVGSGIGVVGGLGPAAGVLGHRLGLVQLAQIDQTSRPGRCAE